FPGDHADVANSLNNLGNCYLSLGEPNRALEFHTLGLEMRQRLFATDHPEVARSLSNVGAAHSNLGDPAAAIDYYGRALRALRLPSDPDRGGGPLTASRLRPLPLTLGVLQGRCYILRKGLPENPTVAHLRACDARIRRAEAASAQDAGALERLWRNRVLADNLEKLWRDREAAEAELNAIAARLRTAAPRYADLRYPKPCTVEDARAALGPGEV